MALYRDGGPVGTPHKKRLKRYLPFIVGCVVAIVSVAGFFWWLSVDTAEPAPVTSEAVSLGTYNPNQTFETEYFSFEAPKDWLFVPDLSKPDMFVYRDMVGSNPTGLFTIYVNRQPPADERKYTHILAVNILDTNSLSSIELSSHCKEVVPNKANRDPQPVNLLGVNFTCYTDWTNFFAAAGVVEGGTQLNMSRRDSSQASYVITYRNTGFNDNRSIFGQVLNTFSAR